MSDTKVQAMPENTIPYGFMRLAGKIIERKKTKDGKAKLILAVPAPDAYSHPATYEISADTPFAQIDDFVDVLLKVTSYAKNTTYKDEFGQPVKNRIYMFFLNYVEHTKA